MEVTNLLDIHTRKGILQPNWNDGGKLLGY